MNYIKITVELSSKELEIMEKFLGWDGYADEHDIKLAIHAIIGELGLRQEDILC